jgi:hypothetical protein
MTLALNLPERLPLGFDLVRASAYLEITESEYNAIRDQVGFKKTDAHGWLSGEVPVAGTALALKGSMGVHDYRGEKDVAEMTTTGFVAHYTVELEAGLTVDKEEEGWAKLSDALAKVLKKHTSSIRLQQFFAPGKVVPATSLPIQLGEAGISGFAEIRGVRLVQPDPSDTKNALYSVILDLTSDGGHAVGTTTVIESRLDEELLTKAITRLAEISGFAYKEVTAQ